MDLDDELFKGFDGDVGFFVEQAPYAVHDFSNRAPDKLEAIFTVYGSLEGHGRYGADMPIVCHAGSGVRFNNFSMGSLVGVPPSLSNEPAVPGSDFVAYVAKTQG